MGKKFAAIVYAGLALATAVQASPSYFNALTNLNPVGYWPLQETAAPAPVTLETNYGALGPVANAYYAATNAGNVTFNQPGALSGDSDTAVFFSSDSLTSQTVTNVNSYAFVPRLTPALTLRPPLSMDCWVNSRFATFGDLFGEGGGTGLNAVAGAGNYGGFRLAWQGGSTGAYLQFYVANGAGTTRNYVSSPANSISLGKWHHLAATYDGTTTKLYVDGVALTTNATTLAGANTMAPDTWSPFVIGAGFWQGKPTHGFNGTLDEVAVYTNILNATQVSNHYQAGASAGNYKQTVLNDKPLLYYRLDSPGYINPTSYLVATNLGSSSINAAYLPGITPGGVPGPANAPFGTNAAPINGVFSAINAGTAPVFNPSGAQPFSALAWFKGNPADGRVQTIIGQGTNWAVNLIGTNGCLAWNLGTAGQVASTAVFNDGNWHFVAGVYDGTDIYLYVDGELNASAAAAGPVAGESGTPLFLGGDADFTVVGGNEQYLAGALAQAAFFTNALTVAQIQNLYNDGNLVPVITQQPLAAIVGTGPGTATNLTALAFGLPALNYQWYFNALSNYAGATALPDDGNYLNATTSQLTVTNLLEADNGFYFVIITNNYGSVTSALANLVTYLPPPTNANETVLKLEFNAVASPTNVYPGFQSMTLNTPSLVFNRTTAITISPLDSFVGNALLADRDRNGLAEPNTVTNAPPALNTALLYNSFIFNDSKVYASGIDILIQHLAPNTVYGVNLWSFDAESGGIARYSDWSEAISGTTIIYPYFFNGSVQPVADYDDTFGALLTSDPNGQLDIQGVEDAESAAAQFAVFVNALVITANPVPLIQKIIVGADGNLQITALARYSGETLTFQESPDLNDWQTQTDAVSVVNHGPVFTAEFPLNARIQFYRVTTATP